MHRLLIVDDDEIIREGLEKNIPWEKNGFTVVASARNGQEGLEFVKTYKPHIVLSDIRMPFMDGLQMTEKIRELSPSTKVVFLTGYDDFDYAKKALNLKAIQYVLKYEENEEILKAVIKARDEFALERKEQEKTQRSKSLLKNKFFADLLAGIGSDELVQNEAALLDISFTAKKFCVAVISIDNYNLFSRKDNASSIELALFSIQNICEEILEGETSDIYCINYNQKINLLFDLSSGDREIRGYLSSILTQVMESVKEYLNIEVTIGVGNIYEGYKNVQISYNEAVIATEMRDVLGKNCVWFSEDIKNGEGSHKALLDRITQYINNNYHKESLSLTEIAYEVHITPAYISTLFKKYKEINFSDYLTDIRMEKAKELIANTDMKAYEVAEKVGYTNSQYFSVLFKKVTGYSPMEFRNRKG